ncbi:MAG: four helix bundle protein [Caldilineaceae bacterium]
MGYEPLEDTEVFRLAERICDRFYVLVQAWDAFDKRTSGDQLVRAADSIGANIAESYGRFGYGEQLQFLYYARGSLYETKYWVHRAQARQLLPEEICLNAIASLERLAVKLNAYIRYRREQRNASKKPNPKLSEATEPYLPITPTDEDDTALF